MNARLTLLICLVCLLMPAVLSAQTQPVVNIEVSLSRDTIGLDEQALLSVVVSGTTQDLPRPNMPTLPMFEVYSQGQSSNYSITNGRVEASVTYRYLILPQKPGDFPIQNISLVYQNKRYKGNVVTLTILDKGSATPPELEERAQGDDGRGKDYFLEAIVDNNKPYVNQQVTLTLKFYIAVKFYGSPGLTEPTTTGFWTEILGNKAPYYQKLNNRDYRVIERKYALFPTQTGVLTIGRAIITATVAGQRSRRGSPFDIFGMGSGEEIQVRSQPIKIDVKPLPTEGRPRDFTGTIGRFSMEAVPNKTTVELNQPVSVEFKINGTGNIKSVAEPTIPELPDFRVYRAASRENVSKYNDQIGGVKTFEEVFIPRVPGTLEIPALSFNYFDPKRGKYQTVSTRPIQVKVSKPEGYTGSNGVVYGGPNVTISSDARDIRYIKTDLGKVRPEGFVLLRSPVYFAVNALPILLFASVMVYRMRREKLSGDVGYARSRAASKMARKRLARARSLAGAGKSGEFFAECSQVVMSYIADKLNISPHGLTSDKIAGVLRERAAEESLIDDTKGFLDKCGFGQYAPGAAGNDDVGHTLAAAEDLMVRMEGVRF